jgi:hypothetical protein
MTTSKVHPDGSVDLPLIWAEFDDVPIFFANHFLVQHEPDEFVLTLGQVSGPPLVGTPDQVRAQLGQIDHVPITTLARVGLTRQRLTELIALLQAELAEHDR